MDYEYYADPLENYNSEGNVNYGLEDDPSLGKGPAQVCTYYTDDFYDDEIENISSSPSPNWQPRIQEMQYHQGHRTNPQNVNLPRQYTGSTSGRYESSINSMYMNRMNGQNQTQSFESNNYNVANGTTQIRQTSNLSQSRTTSSNPRNTHGLRLRPVSDLPDIYRRIFKFGVFNAIQSTCFDMITHENKNLVITGSGKTVLFELGIISTMNQSRNTVKQVKCVYIAPTKALCSERFRDWAIKFEPLGIKCCELTGDTAVLGNNAWGDAKNASIIITTCEKWDSLTRNWHDHHQILCQIQLFMVDEVHILNESRGSTLEVVISRMKFRGSEVRFMLVSATVPNIGDIAAWIGSGVTQSKAAHVYEFGDEYRPCKLTRHVVGLPRRRGQNDFQFAKILDFKLFSIIQQYSVGKPTLVFCSTRKGVFGTAEQLMKEFAENEANKKTLPWARPPRTNHAFVDKRLVELAAFGIGVHHAGLSMDDRRATEDLYLKKIIRVLVATSTLAVGVNLPAHMVIIKGVRTFQNNASVEYSDLDITQMLGRAGRPQFDKDGTAVIMCEIELEQKYKALVQGKTILESSLHINLAEHLNSEIGLGTITDVNTAKDWLRASFLYQRMQRNPGYYALSLENKTVRESVDELVMQSIAQLEKTELINHVEDGGSNGKLTSTEYGEIMSKLYIRRATMELILSLPEKANLREILEVISAAEELQEVKLRASEKLVFNKLRRDIDIRYEVKKVEKTSDKVYLLIQSVLGGISLNSPEYKSADSQPYMEAFTIFKHVARISRAVVEVAICKKLGSQVKNGLELSRCLTAKAWEDRAVVLRQIEQIGEKSIKVLAEHGITSLGILRTQDPLRIETLLNRRPPFGLDVLASVAEFPQYSLSVKETDVFSDRGMNPVQVHLLVECGLVAETSASIKKRQTRRAMNITAVLTLTSDMDLIDFRRIPTKALIKGKSFEVIAELTKPSQTVIVIITSESIAGVALQQTFKPSVTANEYPILDTRPVSCVEQDLVGLEDDPDFWNMNIDSGQDSPPKKTNKTADTAKGTSKHTSQEVAKDYDHVSLEAKPLTNGTYECNHRCRDKNSCRHMCCREGLAQVSKVKLNSQLLEESFKPKVLSGLQRLHPTNKGSVSTDRKMKALESIHERTQVSQNIKLFEGGRLLPQPKRKRQIDPHFDIQFIDLKNPELDDAWDSNGMESDSDHLPEAVLPAVGKEDIPWIGLPHSDMVVTSSKAIKANKTMNSKPVLSSGTTNFDPVDGHPTKRVKTANSSTENGKSIEAALFLELSDSESSVETVPSPKLSQKVRRKRDMDMTSSSIQASKMHQDRDAKFKHPMNPTLSDCCDLSLPRPRQSRHLEIKEAADTVIDSEFAELDAWLQSNSVEIL